MKLWVMRNICKLLRIPLKCIWRLPDPTYSYWLDSYYYENGRYLPGDTIVLIQDHCQTGPLFFLAYMYRVTGDLRYLQAAQKNADFLIRAQNANGSWSHHYNLAQRQGVSTTGVVGGGEVNDYGMSDPVKALLAIARLTGHTKYREAALRGADWLVTAFISNGKVVGWAGQYNYKNQPIEARHHEPAAVTQLGTRWAAVGLLAAYQETKNEKYLVPLRKALDWAVAQHKHDGLWAYYDIVTGRPISMWRRHIYFLDDPKQVQEYKGATGGKDLAHGDFMNFTSLEREVQQATGKVKVAINLPPSREQLQKLVATTAPIFVKSYIEGGDPPLNPAVGLYVSPSPAGLSTRLVHHQIIRFCDLMKRARAMRGDIPISDELLQPIQAFVGWEKIMSAP